VTERWLAVVGYEGLYEVSDHGHVRSVDRTIQYSDGRTRRYTGQCLTPNTQGNDGYPRVTLSRNSSCKTVLVHQLMLKAFVGNPPDGQESLHANDIRTANDLTNLSYGTRSQNVLDQVRNNHHNQASKTFCTNGHEFTDENTYRRPTGGRRCRTCQRKHGAAWNRRRAS
jgi:NUMOD4 motif/HNH endonuclease